MTLLRRPIQGLSLHNRNSKLVVFVSRQNNQVKEILPALKTIIESNPEKLGIRSTSDLLCKWIMEKYDEFIFGLEEDGILPSSSNGLNEIQGDKGGHPETIDDSGSGHTTDDTPSTLSDDDEVKNNTVNSHLKRLLASKPALTIKAKLFKIHTIPSLDKYHEVKIGGKSTSEAFIDGDIDFEQAADIYTSALLVHADLKNDTHFSKIMHFMGSKNDTKKPKRVQWVHDRIKDMLERNERFKSLLDDHNSHEIDPLIVSEHSLSKYNPHDYEEMLEQREIEIKKSIAKDLENLPYETEAPTQIDFGKYNPDDYEEIV